MGDEDFTAFVRARADPLARTGYLLAGDAGRGEDLVQTALEKLWLRRRRVAPEAWEAYVRKIMVTESISWWRLRSSSERPTDAVPDTPGAVDATAGVDDRLLLLTALRRLPARQRAAVVLRHYENRTEGETAALLGCSVGTVKSLTSRGLARLRELLERPSAGLATGRPA